MLADDPALLSAFLDESREALEGLEARLIDLDEATDLAAGIDAIFRPVHTLKGSAPFFGFMEVQRLAHALETILDHLRKGRMERSRAVVDVLLAGLDGLRSCIERIRGGGPEVEDAPGFATLVERLTALGGRQVTDPWTRVLADLTDRELHDEHADPAHQARLARLREGILALRGAPTVPAPPQPAGAGPGARLRQRLGTPLAEPLAAAAAEAVLADLRALRAGIQDAEQERQLDEVLATCQVFIGSVGFDDVLRRHVLEALDRLTPSPSPSPSPSPGQARTAEPVSERRTRPDTETHRMSMRVSEEAVDGFLAHVSEMLVIGDQLEHLERRLSGSAVEPELARDMRQAVASFSVLSTELQRSIMAVRRVPIRSLLQKAPRLARDIAQAAGKDIAVVLNGENTEVDKSRLDLLDGPLTHLVRNCADHGIEPPAQRLAAGKPARGTISLSASTLDGWFVLEIGEDGRGLDLDAIRRKGEALGLVRPGAPMDEQSVIDLIFASGLSTAAAVTDVSGRGVGMDVVKRQIHEAGGQIAVSTRRGQGTTFSIRLPSAVSTQIIPAFVVRDGPAVYALPLDLVRETFADPATRIADGAGLVMRHGAVLPVAPLGRILGQAPATDRQGERRTCVTIERKGTTVAVSVAQTLGVRRLVMRPLAGIAAGDLDGRFRGAALLGDGQLALVIDPDRLMGLIPGIAAHV